MSTKTIHQSVVLRASPKEVYNTLIDSKKHAQFTSAKAKISKKVGGSFSCYDNYITGVNLELIDGKKIIQAWRCSTWPKDIYSIVIFKLSKAKQGKTKLEFTQIGVPTGDYKEKLSGWKTHYWKPLKAIFIKRR